MKVRVAVLSFALLDGLGCDSPPNTGAVDRSFGEPKLAVALQDQAINESSGVARSNAFPGWYYTHNDSGDTARFWKFDLTGKIVGPYTILGAKAFDWEDMASARVGGNNYLYFGDIGDNLAQRKSIQIYRVEEPSGPAGSISKVDILELQYPDGARNAEALLVESSERITIVTKTSKNPAKIYYVDLPKSTEVNKLSEAGSLSVGTAMDATRQITGGDVSADGKYLVLRTYTAAYEYQNATSWWKVKPKEIRTAAELQGEAIAYSLDGKDIVTTSEFAPCLVSKIAIGSSKP